MREITGTTNTSSANGITSSRAAKSAAGQVGAESRRKRGTTSQATDIGCNTGWTIRCVFPRQTILEKGNEGVCSTSREIAIAAGLADSGSSTDWLTGRNTCISWLKPKRDLLSWLRELGLEGLQGLLIGEPGES